MRIWIFSLLVIKIFVLKVVYCLKKIIFVVCLIWMFVKFLNEEFLLIDKLLVMNVLVFFVILIWGLFFGLYDYIFEIDVFFFE